jgi:TPR repeat protein
MSKKRLLFWVLTLFVAISIAFVVIFYFDFESIKKRACDSGNATSCYELGYSYYNGHNKVEKNATKALLYLEKSCNQNDMQGCKLIGDIYTNSDTQKAIFYYDKACDRDDLEACYYIGNLYKNGKNIDKNYTKALLYFEKLCEKEYKDSCYYVAWIYSADSVRDYGKSLSIYDSLCQKQNFDACKGAGWLYASNHINSTEKFQKVVYYYNFACDEGKDAKSCKYVEKMWDKLQTFNTLEQSCNNHNATSCHKIGYTYFWGEDVVPKDENEAKKYYALACDKYNFTKSCKELAFMYHQDSDDINKLKYAIKSCDGGIYGACTDAGSIYRYSEISYNQLAGAVQAGEKLDYYLSKGFVPQNINKAIFYFKKACDNGIIEGCYDLGLLYDGDKNMRDFKKASIYFEKACDKHNDRACYYLGLAYKEGKGVEQDAIKAKGYLKKSCELGNSFACKEYDN